jgi:hypothetical protein
MHVHSRASPTTATRSSMCVCGNDPKGVLGVVVETSPPPYTWALVRWADTEQTVEPVQALTKAPPLA